MKHFLNLKINKKSYGLVRDLNPGPLAPKARIIPLDQRATHIYIMCKFVFIISMFTELLKENN